MKHRRGAPRLFTVAAFTLLAACAAPVERADPGDYRETLQTLQQKRAIQPQVISDDLHVFEVAPGLWVHRSHVELGGQRVHANGMVMITADRISIIDAPWTEKAARELIAWLEARFPGRASRLIVTHAHDDRIGNVDVFVERGIPVYAQRTTARLARAQGLTAPDFLFDTSLPLRSGDQPLELFYPGAGHAPDNIVVWFPEAGVLFGGCLIKSRHADSLGFTGDADRASWPLALRRALARYPHATTVVPGHGLPGDLALISHTLELLGER